LYDLEKDPTEQNNVAEQYPDIVQKMKAVLVKEHVDDKMFPLDKVEN
jgi:arylsulfatase